MCAYYRYYHPIEFITSFLNNAANEEDIRNGTAYANQIGIQVTLPKWGVSRNEYFFDEDKRTIAKGLSSIKYMSANTADELYGLAHLKRYERFVDVLTDIDVLTTINTRQLEILIRLDFFSEYGNQRELLRIMDLFYDMFKKGQAKKVAKEKIDGTPLQEIVARHSIGLTKSGQFSKSYTLFDVNAIMRESEDAVKASGMADVDDMTKVKNFVEVMGYVGYVSNKPEDRPKLYILDIFPVFRKSDGRQFGYSILGKSIGSGRESRYTIYNRVYARCPIQKGDIIYCKSWDRDGKYYTMSNYEKVT